MYRDRRDSYAGHRRDHHDRRSDANSSNGSSSPPPKPRSDKELPESFGRISDAAKEKDDDSNVLQRMSKKFGSAPLGALNKCVERKRKIKVWTRNFKEVRGICTGYVNAFDKHWNLIMSDVDEVFLKPRKSKVPFLEDLHDAAKYSEIPIKVPKKKNPKPQETVATENGEKDGAENAERKKKKRNKKKRQHTGPHKRHVKNIFVRGDNIVMVAVMDESDGDMDDED